MVDFTVYNQLKIGCTLSIYMTLFVRLYVRPSVCLSICLCLRLRLRLRLCLRVCYLYPETGSPITSAAVVEDSRDDDPIGEMLCQVE